MRLSRFLPLAVAGLLVVNLAGGSAAIAAHGFTDVPSGIYYHDAVSWLTSKKITAGCGDGKFCPNDPVSRGQVAVFLERTARLDVLDGSPCNTTSPHKGKLSVTYDAASGGTANVVCVPDTTYTLTAVPSGTNPGTLRDRELSSGEDIECGSRCVATYVSGKQVQIYPSYTAYGTDSTTVFAGFEDSSGCSPTTEYSGACVVAMTQDRSVTGTWLDAAGLSLDVRWTGASPTDEWEVWSRVVARSPRHAGPSIWCTTQHYNGPDGTYSCAANMAEGDVITLEATPGIGAVFTGWAGACAGTAPTCTVSMTQAQSVTASFAY